MSTPPADTTSPPSAPAEEPRRYTRTADAGFGSRLADARNLAHTEVPPAPARPENRTAVGSIASEVAASVRSPAMVPPGAPKYGWEKGSYRNPFEYGIAVGGKTTPSSGRTFSPAVAVPRAFEKMPPVDTSVPAKKVETELESKAEVDRAITPGPDAKERHILLGPLKLIKHAAATLEEADRAILDDFLGKYMAPYLHTVIERDPYIPSIVYKISVLMTDENFAKYNQLLGVFSQAKDMDKMLAKGRSDFDHYTYNIVDGVTREEHVEGWRVLKYAKERELSLEELSQELVCVWKGVWIAGESGYAGAVGEYEE